MSLLSNLDPAFRSYWYPAARLADLGDEPHRAVICGEGVVVVRLDGEIRAFLDRCPHRDARLSDGAVIDDCLRCPYHGWRFNSWGRCTLVPALGEGAVVPERASLQMLAVRIQHDLVFVALDSPRADPIAVPEWGAAHLRAVWLPVVTIAAGAAQFVDNFLDVAHFPFVHAGTFGTPDDELVLDMSVEQTGSGLRLAHDHVINHHEDPGVAAGVRPLQQPRRMEYTFSLPYSARLRLEYPLAGNENTIVVWAVPETEASTVLYTVLLRDGLEDDAAAQAAADYELAVLAEDLRILEALPEPQLELDPRERMHTRADRLTVEMRRLLEAARSG